MGVEFRAVDTFVEAVREDVGGYYVGLLEDREVLECGECRGRTQYRLRYTENERGNIAEHRRTAQRMIEGEHPTHSYKIRVR